MHLHIRDAFYLLLWVHCRKVRESENHFLLYRLSTEKTQCVGAGGANCFVKRAVSLFLWSLTSGESGDIQSALCFWTQNSTVWKPH